MKKKRKKKEKTLEQWLIPKLRRISMYWPVKQEALNAAKVYVDAGFYKNGKAKTKIMYICAECERKKSEVFLYDRKQVEVDHINPVVSLNEKKVKNWNVYIPKLFLKNPKEYQVLDKVCHKAKSLSENKKRKKS